MGIAFYPTDATSAEELLKCADTAMHKTKDIGRNSYSFYSGEMRHDILSRMKYETQLKAALKNKEFELYYQPQYSIDNILRGFEALIRWNSPTLGMVPPLEFIPLAEETGLIHNIGDWVTETAIKQCKAWQEHFDFQGVMAINISPIQLQKDTFIKDAVKLIQNNDIGSHHIELEITESLFIDNYDMALSVLDGLKEEGFRIALDDFGTGYSSLSYLKRLPINLLKIDKSFINELDFDNPEGNITGSIISLVHKLSIETIAEGVETVEQMNYLVHAKCDNLQGYHLGRPMKAEAAEMILLELQETK
jgi:EAL domain-containing protein (putative c-di-GMP-specific phosphodiesterase class I)